LLDRQRLSPPLQQQQALVNVAAPQIGACSICRVALADGQYAVTASETNAAGLTG
jgi:ferredoxin